MRIYREVEGEQIAGIPFYAIVHNFSYFLTTIGVFSDGKIGVWGELLTIDSFKKKLNSGWITLKVPAGEKLIISDHGDLVIENFKLKKTNSDFIKEIEDVINTLNNIPNRIDLCINAFKEYLIDDSQENFDLLKELYDYLPNHKRILFEGIDKEDPLYLLMKNGALISEKDRKYYLYDYFEYTV